MTAGGHSPAANSARGEAGQRPLGPPELPDGLESPEGHGPPPPAPGSIEIVGRGLDLNLAASAAIRRASLYAGGMYLLLLGPVALVFALLTARYGPDLADAILGGDVRRLAIDLGPAPGTLIIGGLAVAAVSVDVQNVAAALIDDQASGRRPGLRPALAIARRSFWSLVGASILSSALTAIAAGVIGAVLGFGNGSASDLDFARQTAVQLVVSMPFAYIGAAVVIGRTRPIEAIRWSIRLARRRWRVAFVIGLVNTATSLLAAFAIGAGGDILARIATGLGLGTEAAPGAIQVAVLAVIVAVAIAAIGSLTMTIAALSVAPQIVAYRRLGGVRRDPDTPDEEATDERSEPLITMGMWVALAVLVLVTAAAIIEFA
ncbi:MAG TPA: hypothetical protein VM427_00770 [Patescibacteria group bacterium]|nr:hypothetical protein [Patescibacteria group bacterium]